MAIITKYLTDTDRQNILIKEDENNAIEEILKNDRKKWNDIISQLLNDTNSNNYIKLNVNKAHDAQILAISHKQDLNDNISIIRQKAQKAISVMSRLKADKSMLYKTGELNFRTTTVAETAVYIDSYLSEINREIELYTYHMDFLKDTRKNIENILYNHATYASLLQTYGRIE
jgi:hypothetical protein